MERRLKERLLGAAIVVGIAVVVIPLLLDGRDEPDSVTQSLDLPATQATERRRHTVELSAPSTADTGAARTAAPTGPAAADPVAVPPPARHSTPASPPAAVTAVPPSSRPAPPGSREATDRPAATPDPAGALAGWAVQVGSFTLEGNARRLSDFLSRAGYAAFVSRNVVNGRVVFRVRVGPETDRERAEAVAERLNADGQPTQIVRHP